MFVSKILKYLIRPFCKHNSGIKVRYVVHAHYTHVKHAKYQTALRYNLTEKHYCDNCGKFLYKFVRYRNLKKDDWRLKGYVK